MPVGFSAPIEKKTISELTRHRAEWQNNANNSYDEEDAAYCNEVIAKIDANIERKSQLSNLGQLLDTDFAMVSDETGKCSLLYPVASDVREDCASVTLIGDDGRIDGMQTMQVSKVEQYVLDHGFDPNGSWS